MHINNSRTGYTRQQASYIIAYPQCRFLCSDSAAVEVCLPNSICAAAKHHGVCIPNLGADVCSIAFNAGDDDDVEREYDRLLDLARDEAEKRNRCFERVRPPRPSRTTARLTDAP